MPKTPHLCRCSAGLHVDAPATDAAALVEAALRERFAVDPSTAVRLVLADYDEVARVAIAALTPTDT